MLLSGLGAGSGEASEGNWFLLPVFVGLGVFDIFPGHETRLFSERKKHCYIISSIKINALF